MKGRRWFKVKQDVCVISPNKMLTSPKSQSRGSRDVNNTREEANPPLDVPHVKLIESHHPNEKPQFQPGSD